MARQHFLIVVNGLDLGVFHQFDGFGHDRGRVEMTQDPAELGVQRLVATRIVRIEFGDHRRDRSGGRPVQPDQAQRHRTQAGEAIPGDLLGRLRR